MTAPPPVSPYDPRDHAPHLRATDAEREAVANIVRGALDDGRIMLDELDDRLGAVYSAKTHGELSAVINDLVPRRIPMTVPRQATPAVRTESDRLILPAFLLCLFFGPFGVHRFYVGKTRSAVAMLILTLSMVGLIVTGVWALLDLIFLVVGAFRDGRDAPMRRWT